ncbi:MAG TPA: hypothetical protein VE758_05115 [Chthoniobacterales bacterium]|nr:hypothetical protein [Chthoniobacterales bacterium]
MKIIRLLCVTLSTIVVGSAVAGPIIETAPAPAPSPEERNSTELFAYESTYTFDSDFRGDRGKLGHGDSLYDDFSYNHRFLITGNWYFRAGVEYERFDFDGTDNGLPDHLQTIHAQLALEYVVHDHAGAGIEINPGPYFQDKVTGDSIDIPWKAFVTFPLKKDKIFGVIGLGGAIYQDPIIAPGGGLIWLFTDQFRLEGVFPKPALVYNPNDDWEFRILGDLFFESYRTDDVVTPMHKLQLHNAVVQYDEERAGGQVTYSGFKPFDIILGGGCTFRRDFDFFRAKQRAKLDPAPYVRVAVEANF